MAGGSWEEAIWLGPLEEWGRRRWGLMRRPDGRGRQCVQRHEGDTTVFPLGVISNSVSQTCRGWDSTESLLSMDFQLLPQIVCLRKNVLGTWDLFLWKQHSRRRARLRPLVFWLARGFQGARVQGVSSPHHSRVDTGEFLHCQSFHSLFVWWDNILSQTGWV